MDKEKKSYYFNVIEAKDGKMNEVMNFNFGGHHDLAAMVENAKASGIFAKDKHAKEFVIGMRLLHHALKKTPTHLSLLSSYLSSKLSNRKCVSNSDASAMIATAGNNISIFR